MILRQAQDIKLMTHTVVGYPTLEKSREIVKTLIGGGADFLELQIPFSDPVADGEAIMHASEVALKNGVNTDRAFQFIDSLKRYHIPKYIMCYYNQVFRYGVERFVKKAKDAGVSGLIVPDIPPEEEKDEKFITLCNRYNLDSIRVISPSSSDERIRINVKLGKGFLYCVSHFGVTGAASIFNKSLFEYIRRVRKITNLPLAVGFGISEREQIRLLLGCAEIAIVGSAIINAYDKNGINGLQRFIRRLKAGTIEQ